MDSSPWVEALVTGAVAVPAGAAGYLVAGRILRLAELRHLLNMALPRVRTW